MSAFSGRGNCPLERKAERSDMVKSIQNGMRKAAKTVAHKARAGRRASVMKPEYLAEIEQYRLMEDDIVAKHLENAPEYITSENGERIMVDKAALANAIREKIENAIRLHILIHDLNCTDPNDMSPSPLRDRVMFLKNTGEGRASLVEIAKARLRKAKKRGTREHND